MRAPLKQLSKISTVTCMSVTADGGWTDDSIYWPLMHTACRSVKFYFYTERRSASSTSTQDVARQVLLLHRTSLGTFYFYTGRRSASSTSTQDVARQVLLLHRTSLGTFYFYTERRSASSTSTQDVARQVLLLHRTSLGTFYFYTARRSASSTSTQDAARSHATSRPTENCAK
jgi:acid phosphatase class B